MVNQRYGEFFGEIDPIVRLRRYLQQLDTEIKIYETELETQERVDAKLVKDEFKDNPTHRRLITERIVAHQKDRDRLYELFPELKEEQTPQETTPE